MRVHTTASYATESLGFHQSTHGAVGDLNALTVQLLPDLLRAVDAVAVGLVHSVDLGHQDLVTLLALAGRAGLSGVVGAGSELQRSADRLDSPSILSGIDVADYFLV